MIKNKITVFVLSILMLITSVAVPVSANEEASVFRVDSINGTRWADYLCVYRGVATTGQNEWGENVVVNAEGIVTEKIPGADIRGKNLAVPEGGMVVSGTGDIGKEMYNSAEIGDKCLFDEYSMRVYFSKGEINPFYTKELRVTGYNDIRWADTVIVYNESGKNTDTNPYGYEVCVGADGYIISAGGNNNLVPQGGYVISATEAKDTDILKMYFTVGAKCILNKNSVTVTYGRLELMKTAESELTSLESAFEEAKKQYKLIDYTAIESEIASIEIGNISTLEERNAVIAQIREIEPRLVESRTVDTRSVWYTVTEDSVEEVRETVAAMKDAGINELVLASNTSKGTIIPIDTDEIPFRRDPVARRIDLLQTYIDECRANGISIVVLVPVMGGSFGENNPDWFDVTNTGEARDEIFFSPANSDYKKAFSDYVKYIITNYDVDGLQLDYIRYPQFYNNVDAGYDEATIALFEEKTGLGRDVVTQIGKQLTQHPQWNTWWNFKTELINGWVKDLYAMATELRPDIYVTAAVAPGDSVANYCQDHSAWVKGGYIDGIYVMSYTEGINEITSEKPLANRGDKSYLVMGCGAYLSISNQSLVEQTNNSIVLGADGTGYFEWGAVRDHRYTEIFKTSLFKTQAIPFTADTAEVVNRLVATAKSRVELYCQTANDSVSAKLQSVMASLPNENADKTALTAAINGLSDALDGDVKKYLTADLDAAIRALNMAKSDYEFVKPTPEEESSDPTSESEQSQPDQPDQSESSLIPEPAVDNQSSAWIYILIAVAVIIALAIAVIVIKKRK